MADKLIFPIGFDLEEGVKKAGRDWKNHYRKRLQDAMDSRPLKVKIDFESKGIDTKEFKQWMALSREAEKVERERIKNAKEWQKVADQAAMAETRRANATNESNARIERANKQAEASERRKRDAVERTNAAYQTQSGYLQRLAIRMAAYFSIHQALNFVRQIREVTAEFELQRISLGALIQDAYKANTIFEQIKVQAVKSPYEIKDLVTYTKRLAAYGVEADDLMDTMNRLADISAGLGADMDRIILAYGQIQAAGVLKGTELRQLTELGIPMVDLLAQYYSTLRNEVVTTADVFDMISKKEIPFEAVKDVLTDLTDEGGRFFDMQSKQAETLAGQWSNMKDALSIMFDEIGRTDEVRGILSSWIDMVKWLTLNWERLWKVIKFVGFAYIGLKGANAIIKTLTASTVSLATAQKHLAASQRAYHAAAGGSLRALNLQMQFTRRATVYQYMAAKATTTWARTINMLKASIMKLLASNVIGWIMLLVGTIASLVIKFGESKDAMDSFRESQREAVKESVENTKLMVANFKRLVNEALKSADGSDRQNQALRKLKQQYGEMFPEYKLTIEYLRSMTDEAGGLTGAFTDMESTIRSFSAGRMRLTLIENYQKQLEELYSDTFAKLTDDRGDNFSKVLAQIESWAFEEGISEAELMEKVQDAFLKTTGQSLEEFYDNISRLSDISVYESGDASLSEWVKELREAGTSGQADALVLLLELAEALRKSNGEIEDMMQSFDNLDPKMASVNSRISRLNTELKGIEENTGGETAENVENAIKQAKTDAINKALTDLFAMENFVIPLQYTFTLWGLDGALKELESSGYKFSDAFYSGIRSVRAIAGDYDDLWREDMANMVAYLDNGTRKVQAYASDQISQFSSLGDALPEVAKRYKELDEQLEQLKKTYNALTNKPIDEQDTQEIEKYRKEVSKVETIMRFLYSFLEKYGGLDKINKKVNPNIKKLEDEYAMVEKIYKKYEEFRKFMGDEQARIEVEKYFEGVDLQWLDKAFSTDELKSQAQEALRILETFWGDTKKAQQNLQFKIGDIDFDDTKRELEDRLKKLSNDISRTKTAKEFFDRMLGMTGDKELSATLTLSVYGTTGEDLKSALVKQVQGAFAGQDLSKAINTDLNSIDLSALREIYNNLPEDFQEEQKKSMKQVLDMLEKEQHDLANNFAKLLMDYDEMEQKRVTITQKATQEVATLEQGLQAQIEGIRQNNEIADKDSAIADATARAESVRKAILAREKLELSKLSPEYIRFFSSINAMAMETANSTRTQLRRALFDAFEQGGISAEELRKELKAIDTQFNKLNENASIFASYVTGGFDSMIAKLRESADELDAIAARMKKLKSLDQMDEGDKNFVNKMLNVFGGKGQKSLSDLAASFNGDMSKMGEVVQQVGGEMQGMFSSAAGAISIVDMIIRSVHQSIEAIQQIIDQVNSMRSEDNQVGGWFKYISDFDKYAMSGWENLKSGNIAGALADTVSSIISIFQNIQEDKIKRLDDEIERQQELLDNLAYSYGRLEKAQERAFGTEYIQNYQRQLENLEAQQEAYLKQANAERSKGKKADEDKIKEYEEQARDAADAIKDMYGTLSEHFLGQDLTSAARDFASAWIDAYKEFSNTTDAMKEKFQDMIQNMIVESLLAKVMEKALEPVFTMIDEMQEGDFYSTSFWQGVMASMQTATENGVVGAENVMSMLEQMGVNLRGLGGEMTGISRDIATASEESILGLAAGINTQNFYISQVPTKLDTIIGLLRGDGAMPQGSAMTLQDVMIAQNQFLSHLPTIAQHTAETVAECKQIVAETRRTADALERVIKPDGTRTTYKMNVVTSYQG